MGVNYRRGNKGIKFLMFYLSTRENVYFFYGSSYSRGN